MKSCELWNLNIIHTQVHAIKVTKVLHGFLSSITIENEIKNQDKYLCLGIIFNHAKFLKGFDLPIFNYFVFNDFPIQYSCSSISKT